VLERRRATDLSAVLLGAGAIVALSFAHGGFFESAWPPATAAFAASGALAAVLVPESVVSRTDAVFIGALGAFAGWQALSAVWSLEPADSLREAERSLVYIAAALASVAVVRRGLAAPVGAGLVAGAAVVTGYSVLRWAFEGPREEPYQGALLNQPLGYANALGLLASLGLVLLLGLAAGNASRRALAAVTPAVAVFAAALVLTSSRGALLALVIGAGTIVVFRSTQAAVRLAWLIGLGLAEAAVLATPLLANLTTLERVLSDRPYYWWTAWHAIPAYAPLGSGAGTFDVLWAEQAPIPVFVRDAHSLYLETLDELGPLGLALVLLALIAPLVAALRAPPTWPTAALVGAYVAFLAHAGFDWDWEMPAVTVFGLSCGAALLVHEAHPRPPVMRGAGIAGLAFLLLVAAAAARLLGG
jgi:hypothetical protein